MTQHAEPASGTFRISAAALRPDAARTRRVPSILDPSPDEVPGGPRGLARARARHATGSSMAATARRGAGVADPEIFPPTPA